MRTTLMPFRFFDPTGRVTISRGDLPHWDQEEATYFITWRTVDSIPKNVWVRWRKERQAWLLAHEINPALPDWRLELEHLPEDARRDFRRFNRALENELDACHGACVLKQQSLTTIVADTLRFLDGTRYQLGDFVIMPNHVHLLAGGLARNAMLKIE
ncbi:MAG: hypothetical protein U0984_07995 [Prosthecobacter sp.]|nr:hypothetical protein [Prosthecobacter sp.]